MGRGSGNMPVYAMHCESVSVQGCYMSRLAKLSLKLFLVCSADSQAKGLVKSVSMHNAPSGMNNTRVC